jgi:DNA repair exonuclease SbcCD nuclease subunit
MDTAAPATTTATTTSTSFNDAANDTFQPIHAPPPPTIYDLDALLLQQQHQGDPSVLQQPYSEYLEQVAYFQTVPQWVVFTDLHISPATLDTCLQVLDRVHAEAVDRQAGIVFLGDWWHVRGTLRVDCLNAVLERMKDWKQPMVLIPGNHDQVTAAITDNHSLTPLQFAYRVPVLPAPEADALLMLSRDIVDVDTAETASVQTTLPGLLIFSHPTVFAQSLWIPHIRSSAVLESVLQSKAADAAVAIFCHADVTGASMNDNIVSQGGVPPRMFPPNKPIYSGHFHKPHKVTAVTKDENGIKQVRCIEYLGSPYEVSLSEAQQPKALAVLDASQGWKCIDRIPVEAGRKHFRPATLRDFLALRVASVFPPTPETTMGGAATIIVRAGDRVVFSISKEKVEDLRRTPQNLSPDTLSTTRGDANKSLPTNALDKQVALLRGAGVMVEIREVKEKPEAPMLAVDAVATVTEDLTTASLWSAFLAQELERGAMSVASQEILQKYGMDILEEIEDAGGQAVDGNGAEFSLSQQGSNATGAATKGTDFELHSVTVKGFGPFRDEISYPLFNRGLVLLRGSNKDGGSDRYVWRAEQR